MCVGPSFVDVILEESNYVFEHSDLLGVSLFTDEYEEIEKLPRRTVLEHLQQLNYSGVVEAYLVLLLKFARLINTGLPQEHITNVWKEQDEFFIDELLKLYIESLRKITSLSPHPNNGDNLSGVLHEVLYPVSGVISLPNSIGGGNDYLPKSC